MRFTESHEWVRVEGDEAVVGITDHAQQELGDIVYVELPEVGRSVKAGEEVCVLESTKAAADVYAPISGEITMVNKILAEASETVNQSPEQEGWLLKLRVTASAELERLMDEGAYKALIG